MKNFINVKFMLFIVDVIFITFALYIFGAKRPFVYTGLFDLFKNVIYLCVIVSVLPFICAFTLGIIGDYVWEKIMQRTNTILNYFIMLVVIIANAFITKSFVAHEVKFFNIFIDIMYIQIIFTIFIFLAVFKKRMIKINDYE